jgi:5'-deoxynucleotidase YfbR-like HD superfamily hydrolase
VAADHGHDPAIPKVCIKTWPSKVYFDLLDPKVYDIKPVDIAHHLSMCNRFVGGTPQPYSVAEHCLNVSAMLERRFNDPMLELAGLLHDATEAYLGDVSGLLKKTDALSGYREIEDHLSRVIERRFGLESHALEDARVKQADKDCFDAECVFVRDNEARIPCDHTRVRELWLRRLGQLSPQGLRR